MITLTEIAVKKLHELIEEDTECKGLRVYVKGGGCSGYSYGMAMEPNITDDDTIIEKDGIVVIIDPQSMPLLSGSEIDYTDSLMGSGFAVKNPQAKTQCGCGSSFGV